MYIINTHARTHSQSQTHIYIGLSNKLLLDSEVFRFATKWC